MRRIASFPGLVCITAVVTGLAVGGCALFKSTPPDAAAAFDTAKGLLDAGDTNGAVQYLLNLSSDRSFGVQRGSLFAGAVSTMLKQGAVSNAQEKFAWAAASDPELAAASFDIIPSFLSSTGDKQGLQAWSARLIDMPFTDAISSRAFSIHLDACLANGDMDRVTVVVRNCVKKFNAPLARGILAPVIDGLMARGKTAEAGKVIDVVDVEAVNSQDLKNMVLLGRTVLTAALEKWGDLELQFAKAATELPDGDLQSCVSKVVAITNLKGKTDLTDKLCELIIQKFPAKPAAASEAATQWLNSAKAKKDINLQAARLDTLAKSELPVQYVFGQFNSRVYDILKDMKKEDIKKVVATGDTILAKLTNEDDRSDMKALLLDATYLADDFDRALALIEAGLPGREKSWQQMGVYKIKAHILEKNGKYLEAIESLRKFMEFIAKWERPEQDPMTGISYSKELCLGINYKRIGNWYDKAGRKEDAAKAYQDARTNLEKALSAVAADSKEAVLTRTEISAIPEAGKK